MRVNRLGSQRGSAVILVAVSMVLLLAMAAMAVDVGYLMMIRGELQNAADSGALAGAQVLYNATGTEVNAGANAVASQYVVLHSSEKAVVQAQSVERGHWSFATRTFTPNDRLVPPDLWNRTTAELDADVDFINAVRVVTRRKVMPAEGNQPEHVERPFFARIFGVEGARMTTTAVGYIGFAGTLQPLTMDQPLAICKQAILDQNERYTCGVGRMINSGSTIGHQTGGWTNFTQGPCDTASSPTVRPLVCQPGGANPGALFLGGGMGTVGGELQTVYDSMLACWAGVANYNPNVTPPPTEPWKMTLPVVDCPGNNTGNCSTVVGAVTVNVIWITRNDKNQMVEVPRKMADWPGLSDGVPIDATGRCAGTGQQCWDSFVNHFQLRDVLNNSPATYEDKTIYFLPDCTPHETMGTTGGQNFGMLARIPVLVR